MPRRRDKGRHRAPRTVRVGPTARHATVLLVAASTVLLSNTGASTPVRGHPSADRVAVSEAALTPATPTGPQRTGAQGEASRPSDRAAPAVEERRSAMLEAERRRASRAARRIAAQREAARTWVSPLHRMRLTSGFGQRWGRLHAGSDFAVRGGTPVRAMSSGTVTSVRFTATSGHRVQIRYWDGTVSYYFHLSSSDVRTGQRVSPGEVVARSGNTGRSTGPHLHLEIHPRGGKPVNPVPWLRAHHLR